MGGPEGEIPAPWFANGGLAAVSPPCNRGSGLPSLPSPPVRGRTKCTVCTLCVLVKARLPSPWRLGTGTEDRGPLRGWKTRLKLFTYGFFLGQVHHYSGLWKGFLKKSPEVAQKFDSLVGAAVMEMQRWSLRWKTKRGIMDSTLTAFITLFLVLQAATVRAGKIGMVSDELILTERGKKNRWWRSRD